MKRKNRGMGGEMGDGGDRFVCVKGKYLFFTSTTHTRRGEKACLVECKIHEELELHFLSV